MSWYEWREAPECEFAVVGDPISHSWSDVMHGAAFQALGLPYSYIRIRVPLEEFGEAMDRLSKVVLIGLNVTVPLKEAAFRWCSRVVGAFDELGSVNTIRLSDRAGTNTDATGFLETLRVLRLPVPFSAVVLGAGGSARAVVAALCSEDNTAEVWNRDPDRAMRLVNELGVRAAVQESLDLSQADLIVNATAAGLHEHVFPLDLSSARPEAIAYDLQYGSIATPFVRAARVRELKTFGGEGLLVAQGALALEFWLGKNAPREAMLAALKDAPVVRAAEALRAGELAVIPTETVYGLAADATNPEAVEKIYSAKGRPSENPLIVHVSSLDQARGLVKTMPDYAVRLAEAFWPGPLTLVLPKNEVIPGIVTAGLETVAVRQPHHPLAARIIRLAGCPVAAPSANPYMALSPTRVEMLADSILDAAAAVVDGGPCEVGIESTVVDCTGESPVILRPGAITSMQIAEVTGLEVLTSAGEDHRSPGQYRKHYSPKAKVVLVEKLDPGLTGLVFGPPMNPTQRGMPSVASEYARLLYAQLAALDEMGLEVIYVEQPPDGPEWAAVWDRLQKAVGE